MSLKKRRDRRDVKICVIKPFVKCYSICKANNLVGCVAAL